MLPKLTRRISFKLARTGVIIAFLLGLLLSSLQVYDDYRQHEVELNSTIQRILEAAQPPAVRAVHTLDNRLAQEVVNGLLEYDFVHQVRVLDELGQSLAEGAKPERRSPTRWITSNIDSPYRTYPLSLNMTQYDLAQAGLLEVVIDVDLALAPFFKRAINVLVGGIIRNLVLVFLLFLSFRILLGRDLTNLSTDLGQIDPNDPRQSRLKVSQRHRRDEIGQLVATINGFITSVEQRLEERSRAEHFLRDSENQMRQIIDTVPHLIYAKDRHGRFMFANRALADFYMTQPDHFDGLSHESLHRPLSTVEATRMDGEDREVIETGKVMFVPEHVLTTPAGTKRIMQSNKIPFQFFGEPCTLVISVDITERIEAEQQIEQLAFIDPITSLPNRNLFLDRLSMELTRGRTHEQYGALFLIDLDNFKTINDSLGHSVGDELLRHVARKLRENLKEEVTLARMGGDEFAVIIPELSPNRDMAEKSAQLISAKLVRELASPFRFGGREFLTTASLGMALFPDSDASVEEILRFADTALFQAKTAGRNQTMLFASEMADAVSKRLSLETELRDALRDQQLVFYFQPQVNVVEGRIVGAESLLRWIHPQRGIVPPDEFIPVMESSGLILQASKVLLTQACLQLREWIDVGAWQMSQRLAINISPRQFHQTDFVEQVIEVLEATGIPATCLDLELTESIIIQNVKDTIHKMMSLRAIGVRFSLDDFGTGYSSLSYLKRLPVDALKIDRSFVKDVTRDANDAAIVATIIAMAENLDLDVVAEGVETEDQLQFLEQHRCQTYQGYLFSRPVPAENLQELLFDQLQLGGGDEKRIPL